MLAAWTAVSGAASSSPQEAVPCIECRILSVSVDQVGAVSRNLSGLSVAVRVLPGAPVPFAEMARLRAAGARPGLDVLGVPAASDPLLVSGAAFMVVEPDGGEPDRLAFELKGALAAARGAHPQARLLVAATPGLTAALRDRGLEAYVDGFVRPAIPLMSATDLLAPIDAGVTIVSRLPEGDAAANEIAIAAASLADWFPAGLVTAAGRTLGCQGRALPALLNPRTLDLVATTRACPPGASVTSGEDTGNAAERVDIGDLSAFRVRNDGSARFAENVTVGAARALTVDEIVARHQAFLARQTAAVRTDVAAGTLTLTFELPTFVAPVTITSNTTIYRDRTRVDLRQSDIRVNGVPFSPGDGVPRLPMIEPERVAAVPLTITLTDVYRYRLDGREVIDGHACYLIAFSPRQDGIEPAARSRSLFTGRAWIDQQTFAMVHVSAAQTNLRGPIVASEQSDTFAPDAEGLWLLERSDIRQAYEGANVRTPIHRLLVLDRHEINGADFVRRRDDAYASPDVILRDTPDGFRYLKRETGSHLSEAVTREGGQAEVPARSVVPAVTHIRTFAAGVIVDPNITTPLPFAGLSYADFDLFHTGTQFNGFFGGSYGQLAFSAPSIAGSRWQIAGRAFGIAASYNDRAFVNGTEVYSRDIRQQPAQASIWVLRPMTSRAAVRVEYDWDYNRFSRADVTDPAFVVPRNQNAHGLRAGVDLQRNGWQASIWGSHTIRLGWERWGIPGSAEDAPAQPSFQRAGASLLRTGALSPRLTTRVELSAMAGRHTDRFSRMTFGTFDNRLHGYPSSLIRYDRGAVLRSAISWAAARAIRVDGFADTAAVHDPAFGRGLRSYTGFGTALDCPGPFSTLLSVEWGFGVQGVNTDGRLGTQVVRITGYKVF